MNYIASETERMVHDLNARVESVPEHHDINCIIENSSVIGDLMWPKTNQVKACKIKREIFENRDFYLCLGAAIAEIITKERYQSSRNCK